MRFAEKYPRRSQRRHQRERALTQALGIARFRFSNLSRHTTREENEAEARRWAVRIYQHPKSCSCWMCGNPRRYAKGQDRFTIQERRAAFEEAA